MKIAFSLLLILLLSIGIGMLCFSILHRTSIICFERLLCFLHKFLFVAENEGPIKVTEAKICDVKLYDYCDEDCYNNCPKIFGARAIGFCNFNPQVCICRRQC